MKPKLKPEIKRIKIDDHIKASKGINNQAQPRKRGRPRKTAIAVDATDSNSSGHSPFSDNNVEPIEKNTDISEPLRAIEPVYDTTEEAKAFISAPFDVAAGFTGIQKMSLYPAQLNAVAPSFKVFYDKRISPALGDNADIYAFVVVLLGIVAEKVQVYKDEKQKQKPVPPQNVDQENKPYIPTEHHA